MFPRSLSEIDLVCDNEFTGELVFYEVKRDAYRISLADLERKGRVWNFITMKKCVVCGLTVGGEYDKLHRDEN